MAAFSPPVDVREDYFCAGAEVRLGRGVAYVALGWAGTLAPVLRAFPVRRVDLAWPRAGAQTRLILVGDCHRASWEATPAGRRLCAAVAEWQRRLGAQTVWIWEMDSNQPAAPGPFILAYPQTRQRAGRWVAADTWRHLSPRCRKLWVGALRYPQRTARQLQSPRLCQTLAAQLESTLALRLRQANLGTAVGELPSPTQLAWEKQRQAVARRLEQFVRLLRNPRPQSEHLIHQAATLGRQIADLEICTALLTAPASKHVVVYAGDGHVRRLLRWLKHGQVAGPVIAHRLDPAGLVPGDFLPERV